MVEELTAKKEREYRLIDRVLAGITRIFMS